MVKRVCLSTAGERGSSEQSYSPSVATLGGFFNNGSICALVAFLLLAVMNCAVKSARGTLPTLEVLFFRFAIGAVLLSIFSARQYLARSDWLNRLAPRGSVKLHLARATLGVFASGCFIYAAPFLPLASATAISFTNPLILALLGCIFLKETIPALRWLSIVLGIAGVVLVVHPMGAAAGMSSSASSLIASLVMLVGCVAAASSDIVAKTLTGEKWRMQSTSIVLIFFCLSALMLLPVMPFIWQTPDLRHVGLLAVVGVAGVTFQLLLTRALSLSKASAIAPFSYTSLIWATMLGFAFWKDLPAGSELLGVLFIVADGLLAWYTNREKDLSRIDAGTVSKSLSGVNGSRLQSRRAKSLYRTKRRKEKKRVP